MPLPMLYRQETKSLQETERGKITNPTTYFILPPKKMIAKPLLSVGNTAVNHNKTILADDPNNPRYKGPDKPPFHHERQRRNRGWPNENGNVAMDSKLIYERKLGHWTFVWVYGKSIRENQAEKIHVAAIDLGVRTFLTWYSVTAISVTFKIW